MKEKKALIMLLVISIILNIFLFMLYLDTKDITSYKNPECVLNRDCESGICEGSEAMQICSESGTNYQIACQQDYA